MGAAPVDGRLRARGMESAAFRTRVDQSFMAHTDRAGAQRHWHLAVVADQLQHQAGVSEDTPRACRGLAPSGPVPSIDVFLPTYGEDVAVLRNTYTHVKAMEWAGRVEVHVLDDGDRGEVRDLAAQFGFDYASCVRIAGT